MVSVEGVVKQQFNNARLFLTLLIGLLVFALFFLLSTLHTEGTSWGWQSLLPTFTVIPVAQELGVYMPLVIGALLSASSFGSHACFFSDSSLLAAQGAGCSPMSHAFTQFPYAILGAVLSVTAFLAFGFACA